jgi:hypothetical protein
MNEPVSINDRLTISISRCPRNQHHCVVCDCYIDERGAQPYVYEGEGCWGAICHRCLVLSPTEFLGQCETTALRREAKARWLRQTASQLAVSRPSLQRVQQQEASANATDDIPF